MIKKYNIIKTWLKNNPKHFFVIMMGILILSFVFSLIQYFFFPQSNETMIIYKNYAKGINSEKVIQEHEKKQKMEKIIIELEYFKNKRTHEGLQKKDSLRIDYLYNQYQQLKN